MIHRMIWMIHSKRTAAWLDVHEPLQPLIFTDEERAAWEAARKERKEWSLAHADERLEKLKRMWE